MRAGCDHACLLCACLFVSVRFLCTVLGELRAPARVFMLCVVVVVDNTIGLIWVCIQVPLSVFVFRWLYSKPIWVCVPVRVPCLSGVCECVPQRRWLRRARSPKPGERWHTWPVKRALHLTVQLPPGLRWVALGLFSGEMLSQSKEDEIHRLSTHKEALPWFRAYWSMFEFTNYTPVIICQQDLSHFVRDKFAPKQAHPVLKNH